MACLTIGASAQEPATSPYGLYVANCAVTEENAADIFGDGTAVYDGVSNTLTLNGFNRAEVSTVDFEGALVRFSVYAEKGTHIRITGEGNVLHDAVCTVGGNIMIDTAKVTFGGEGFSLLLCCLNAQSGKTGDIRISDSTVSFGGFSGVQREGIRARNLIIERSSFALDTVQRGQYTTLFCAEKELYSQNSVFSLRMPLPLVSYVFQGGEMVFNQSVLDIRDAECVFYATEANGAKGSLIFQQSTVSVKNSCHLANTVQTSAIDSVIEAELYYSGIRTSQSPKSPSLSLSGSKVTLSCRSFEEMEALQLRRIWDADSEQQEMFRHSYERYISYFYTKYQNNFAQGFAAAISGGDVLFEKSNFSCEGFRTGLFAQYAVTLTVGKGTTLDLKAEEAAFVMASSYENALTLPNRARVRFSSLRQMSADPALTSDCPYLYGAAKKRMTMPTAQQAEPNADLLDLLGGEATHIRIRTAPYLPLWLSLTIAGTAALLALGGGIFFIIKGETAQKRKK